MSWINHYLRCSYEDGARGPDRYDCWGLVREARHLHQGKRLLPSWGDVRKTQPKDFTRAYMREARAMQVCRPEPGAIAVVLRGHVCTHVALVAEVGGRLKILEINPARGARCLPLGDFEREHLKVIYYRDAPTDDPHPAGQIQR